MDTSVWIDVLGKNQRFKVQPENFSQIITCPPIIQEILQGIRDQSIFEQIREGILALPRIGDPAKLEYYLLASDIYRSGRKKGFTIRSTVDCLIASIAIQEKVTLWHHDRDFEAIAQFTDLELCCDNPF